MILKLQNTSLYFLANYGFECAIGKFRSLDKEEALRGFKKLEDNELGRTSGEMAVAAG